MFMTHLQAKFHSQSSKTSNLVFIVIKREAKYILGVVRGFVLRYEKNWRKNIAYFSVVCYHPSIQESVLSGTIKLIPLLKLCSYQVIVNDYYYYY